MTGAGSIRIYGEDRSMKYYDRWRGQEQKVLWIDGEDRSRLYYDRWMGYEHGVLE